MDYPSFKLVIVGDGGTGSFIRRFSVFVNVVTLSNGKRSESENFVRIFLKKISCVFLAAKQSVVRKFLFFFVIDLLFCGFANFGCVVCSCD